MNLIQSQSPKVRIRFPIRKKDSTAKATCKSGDKSEANTIDNSGWISTKKTKNPRKRSAKVKDTKMGSMKKPTKKRKPDTKDEQKSVEVIDILDNSSDDGNSYVNLSTKTAHISKAKQRLSSKKDKGALSDDLESSGSEYEFE